MRANRKILNVCGGVEWMDAYQGSRDVVEGFVETGLRFPGVMDLAMFYRFQHREPFLASGGPPRTKTSSGSGSCFRA